MDKFNTKDAEGILKEFVPHPNQFTVGISEPKSFDSLLEENCQRRLDGSSRVVAASCDVDFDYPGFNLLDCIDEDLKSSYLSKNLTMQEIRKTVGIATLYWGKAIQFFSNTIKSSEKCKEYLKARPRTFARMVGYFYGVLSRNCVGTDFKNADMVIKRFEMPEEFDEEREAMDKTPWLLPLTGSLYDDLRANYVAKQVLKMDYADAELLVDAILATIIREQMSAWILTGLTTRFVMPINICSNEDDVLEFIQNFDEEDGLREAQVDDDLSPANNELAKKVIMRQLRFARSDILAVLCRDESIRNFSQTPIYVPYQNGVASNLMADANKVPTGNAMMTLFADYYDEVVDLMATQRKGIFNNAAKEYAQFGEIESLNYSDDSTMSTYKSTLLDRERLELMRIRTRVKEREKKEQRGVFVRSAEYKKLSKAAEIIEKQEKEITRLKESIKSSDSSDSSKDQKIKNQAARIEKLEERLRKAEAAAEQARLAEEEAAEQVKSLQKMIDQMQQMGDSFEDEVGEPLDTSIFDNLNIVCVGGHQTWAKAMRGFHENVRIFDAEGPTPTENVIKMADALWFQSNCLAHRVFYKVVDIARSNKIPIKYFDYAGHIQCKKQIVDETGAMFGGL